VTVDSLVSERELPEILKDKEMLERWKALAEVPDPDRDRILFVIDGLIRDAKPGRLTRPAPKSARKVRLRRVHWDSPSLEPVIPSPHLFSGLRVAPPGAENVVERPTIR
jgi:hypothetical protein